MPLFLLASPALGAQRVARFVQALSTRCPTDRFQTSISVVNGSASVARVRVAGVTRIDAGDGACGQTYASLGIAAGQTAVFTPTGWVNVAPGSTASFYSALPHSGGLFSIYGTATLQQPNAAVTISGQTIILADDIGSIAMTVPLIFAGSTGP